MFEATLKIAQELSKELNVTNPRTLSLRDVPGTSRAILPYLKKYGVEFISLGINGGSAFVDTPDIFVWRDEATDSEVIFTRDDGYGGGIHLLPENERKLFTLPNGVALYCSWKGDNAGG